MKRDGRPDRRRGEVCERRSDRTFAGTARGVESRGETNRCRRAADAISRDYGEFGRAARRAVMGSLKIRMLYG
jgi:hypothetical protein